MIALATAVFLASVLGSLHCVGMCGGFVVMLFGSAAPEDRRSVMVGYHGGRLLSYSVLGALAGGAGSLVDLGSSLAGAQSLAMPLAAASVVVFATVTLLRRGGWRIRLVRPPAWWSAAVRKLQSTAMKLPSGRRAFALGLLTTLLPCGWLYAFAFTAAGTGHPVAGAALMAVFWAGTVPLLAAAGLGVQKLAGPLAARVPGVACVVLIAVGLASLAGRLPLEAEVIAQRVEARAAESEASADAAAEFTAASHVPHVPSVADTPVCCPLGELAQGEAP